MKTYNTLIDTASNLTYKNYAIKNLSKTKLTFRILCKLSNIKNDFPFKDNICQMSIWHKTQIKNLSIIDINPTENNNISFLDFGLTEDLIVNNLYIQNKYVWVERSIEVNEDFFSDSCFQINIRLCFPLKNNTVDFDLYIKEKQLLINDVLFERFLPLEDYSIIYSYSDTLDQRLITLEPDHSTHIHKNSVIHYPDYSSTVLDIWSNGKKFICNDKGIIVIICLNSIKISINNQTIYLPDKSIIFIKLKTDEILNISSAQPKYTSFFIDLSSDMDFLDKINLSYNTPINVDNIEEINQMVINIYRDKKKNIPNKEISEDISIKSLLLMISNSLYLYPTHSNSTIEKIHYDIYNHPEKKWTLQYCCKIALMSPSYFQKKYHDLYNCGFTNDVINSRMIFAKKQLTNDLLSISAISEMAGYDNVTHFIRQFKNLNGISPNQYRKALKFHSSTKK